MHSIKRFSLTVVGLVFTFMPAAPVLAITANTHASIKTETAGPPSGVTAQADNGTEISQTKLSENKLKACQNREKAINNILSRIAGRGQKQLDLFTKIADRTEQFYTDKGRSLSNYDDLVADVNAKKQAAQDTLDQVKSTSVTFKCDGSDPKGAAQSFKDALKSEIEVLKAYKTSVKNLIVGVKSAQSTSTDNKTEENQ